MDDSHKLADVRVGLFVLAALSILVVGSLWIAGSTFFGAKRVSYTVLLQDSAGLQTGDRVRVAGVAVGRVQSIRLDPEAEWPVAFEVAIRRELAIKADASATIATTGLLGASFLQILPGSPGAPPLAPGGEIRGAAAAGLDQALERVDELAGKATAMIDGTNDLVTRLSDEIGPILGQLQALLSERNADDLRAILASLRRTTDDAGPRVTQLLDRLDSVGARLEDGMEPVPALTDDLAALLRDVRAAVGQDGARLAALLEHAESGLVRVDEALAVVGDNRVPLEDALRDLRATASNLKSFSQTIKERPYSMVRVKPEPDRRPGDGVEGGGR